jgi:septal ring factor EnvC (AmiA/AmiB activator)
MAKRQRKATESGVVERLSRRGEETLGRLMDDFGRNERVTDALGRAMSAKGKFDTASKRALSQVGMAPADDLEELRKHVARLEKRLAKLEGGAGSRTSAKRSETKKTSTAKRQTTRTRKKEEKAPSPPAGRALGGGSGRGASAGGGTAAT